MIRRIAIRIALAILGLILLGMITIWIYVLTHKPEILKKLTAEINSRVNAEVKIGGLDLSFFNSFPDISILLTSVSVRDSLWSQHHHNLLDAQKIFFQFNPLGLLRKKPSVSKIVIEEGTIYIYSDSAGYTNTAILRDGPSAAKSKTPVLPGISLRNLHFVIDETYRKKLFEFNIQRLDCASTAEENVLDFRVNLAVQVQSLSFNTDKGSFLKEKQVSGKISVQFNPTSKVLQFSNIALRMDEDLFSFTGKFFLGEKPPPYQLIISTGKIGYAKAVELLPLNISEKMGKYNLSGPISIVCTLDGTSMDSKDPLINIKMKTNKSNVTTPLGNFQSASFSGTFTNQWKSSLPRGDANSRLLFSNFSGKWENFLIQSTAISINNLDEPLLNCDLHCLFDLSALNDLSGSKTIHFEKGNGKLDIVFQGPLQNSDSIQTQMNGNIKINHASIYYSPRDFLLSDCAGTIRFKGQDLYIDELLANAGTTRLKMNGSAQNLLSLMDKDPEKLVLDWNITSKTLNLHDFIYFLKKQSDTVSRKKEKSSLAKTGSQIDRMLKDCTIRLQLKANQLIYKKFYGTNMAATVLLAYDQIALQNVLLEHAGGSLTVKGSVKNTGASNFITLQSQMNKVDLPKVFAAFNNFGQTAILDKNLGGKLNAAINISGSISDAAELDANSLTGTVDWTLEDGRLIQFEPLEKISKLAFKNRSFSDIYFAELKDRFEIKGTEIKIGRMEIQSTAMTMFTEGIYDIKRGADMSIQIPLSNLKSKNEDAIPINKGISSKTGISLRLRAKTGNDGKLNVSWDPFKRALKK